jgi:hypothetical protein
MSAQPARTYYQGHQCGHQSDPSHDFINPASYRGLLERNQITREHGRLTIGADVEWRSKGATGQQGTRSQGKVQLLHNAICHFFLFIAIQLLPLLLFFLLIFLLFILFLLIGRLLVI